MASEVAPYTCPYCGQTFTKKSTLSSHIRKVHGEGVEKQVPAPISVSVGMSSPIRVSEASIKEFEEFQPESARKEGESTMDRIYRMLLEGTEVYKYTGPYIYRFYCPDDVYEVTFKTYVEVKAKDEYIVAFYDKKPEL